MEDVVSSEARNKNQSVQASLDLQSEVIFRALNRSDAFKRPVPTTYSYNSTY